MARNYEIGSGSRCAFGNQSTWGTPASPSSLLPMRSESIVVSSTKSAEETLVASKTQNEASLESIRVNGGISMWLRPSIVDPLFTMALGKKSNGKYILAEPDDDVKFCTIAMERGSQLAKYSNVACSSLTISADAQKTVGIELQLLGWKEENLISFPSLTAITEKSFKCTNASCTIDGGSALPIETMSISINNNLIEGPVTYLTGMFIGESAYGQRAVTASFTLPFGAEYKNIASNLTTDSDIELHLEFDNGQGYGIEIDIPHLSISSANGNVGGSGLIDGSISGTALSVGSDEPIEITYTTPTTV